MRIPLANGDTGIQRIESIVGSIATVGTFNLVVMRSLWKGRVRIANDGDSHGMAKTGIPIVFDDSCLALMLAPDSTGTGVPELTATIVNS